jgi:hypothetical protein
MRIIEMGKKSIRKAQLIAFALGLGVVVASGAMLGQSTSSGSVLFRIVLPHSMMCVGDRHLEVESELRNVSEHPISLSPAGIRAHVSFTNRACSLEDGFRSTTISTDPASGWKGGKVVTLAPDQSYRQILKLELDPDFFVQGVYRVQIGYSGKYGAGGQAELFSETLNSNEALFEVGDCAGSSAKKR